MLLWIEKLSRKTVFIVGTIIIASLVHALGLCFLFIVYGGSLPSYSFTVSKRNFLCKGASVVMGLPCKEESKELVSPTTIDTQSVVASEEKIVPERNVVEVVESPVVPQAVADAPKKLQSVTEKKKVEASKNKKDNKEAKKEQKVVDKPVASVQKKADVHNSKVPVEHENLSLAQMEQELYDQVNRQWILPAGLSVELATTVTIIVGMNGRLRDVVMTTPSGVAAHDVSVEQAVRKSVFPRWAWGKQFTITFKQ